MLRKAATGSAKNITPNRLKPRSKVSGGKRWDAASSRTSCAYVRPALARRWRASPDCCSEMSTPSTRPFGPTASASLRTVVPVPQPMSKTRSPRVGDAAASAASVTSAISRSMRVCSVTQRRVASLFQNVRCANSGGRPGVAQSASCCRGSLGTIVGWASGPRKSALRDGRAFR